MPTFKEFLTQFGWPEVIATLIIAGIIIFIRERHHIFGRSPAKTPPPSME